MEWNNLSVAIISLITALFAGTGLKVVERFLQKSKEKDDAATGIRNELRAELTALKVEMLAVERDLDVWKAKYYEVIEKYIIAKAHLEAAMKILKDRGIEPPPPPPPLTGNGG